MSYGNIVIIIKLEWIYIQYTQSHFTTSIAVEIWEEYFMLLFSLEDNTFSNLHMSSSSYDKQRKLRISSAITGVKDFDWLVYYDSYYILQTLDVIIISLSSQLLLFIKNEYKGAINLTTVASLGYFVIVVGCSYCLNLKNVSFSNKRFQLHYFGDVLK